MKRAHSRNEWLDVCETVCGGACPYGWLRPTWQVVYLLNAIRQNRDNRPTRANASAYSPESPRVDVLRVYQQTLSEKTVVL